MTTGLRPPKAASEDDRAISAAVQALLNARDETVSDLAYHTRISVASLYRKLGGQASWKAADLGAVARHFSVLPGDLFHGSAVVDTATRDQKVRGSNPFGRASIRHGRRRTDRIATRRLAIVV